MKKYQIIQESLKSKVSVAEASEMLGLSKRQIIRLRKGVSEKGKDAVNHGNIGKAPITKLSNEQRQKIKEQYQTKYYGCNYQHFIELLEENEGIKISNNTAKDILNSYGIKSPRTRRKRKKHVRRERREHEGSLVQTDATTHDFFSTGEKYCIHGVIDDATGKVLGLYMTKNESLEGYYCVFEQMVTNFGIPNNVYADRHAIFVSTAAKRLTIEDTSI